MKKISINFSLFKEWAKTEKQPLATLALMANISPSMADKLLRGTYGSIPTENTREKIASVIGKPVGVLFKETDIAA